MEVRNFDPTVHNPNCPNCGKPGKYIRNYGNPPPGGELGLPEEVIINPATHVFGCGSECKDLQYIILPDHDSIYRVMNPVQAA